MNEAHTNERRGKMPLRVLIARMRHEGCGGAVRAELPASTAYPAGRCGGSCCAVMEGTADG
jgi:hypothetical protein